MGLKVAGGRVGNADWGGWVICGGPVTGAPVTGAPVTGLALNSKRITCNI